MANSKHGPKEFAPKDFMLHYEAQQQQQRQSGRYKPTAKDQPMTQEGWNRFAASIRAFNPQAKARQ